MGRIEGRNYVRGKVRERDKHTCQDCGLIRTLEFIKENNQKIKGLRGKIKNLDVHHLNGLCGKKTYKYDRISEIEGLITLCHKCHYKRHDFSMVVEPKAR